MLSIGIILEIKPTGSSRDPKPIQTNHFHQFNFDVLVKSPPNSTKIAYIGMLLHVIASIEEKFVPAQQQLQ